MTTKLSRQKRYTNDSGRDFLQECMENFTPEEFRGAMKFTIGKYLSRFGKKDDPVIEAHKIMDYAERWDEYENSIFDKTDVEIPKEVTNFCCTECHSLNLTTSNKLKWDSTSLKWVFAMPPEEYGDYITCQDCNHEMNFKYFGTNEDSNEST